MLEFRNILAYILVAHGFVVHAVEIGIKRDDYLLGRECLSAIEEITAHSAVALQVFKRFATPEPQEKVHLVFRETQLSRIGNYDIGTATPFGHIIDFHIVEVPVLFIFLPDVDIITIYLVIESTLGDIEFGRFLSHREKQGPHLHLRLGQDIVLKEKRRYSHNRNTYNEWRHDAYQ